MPIGQAGQDGGYKNWIPEHGRHTPGALAAVDDQDEEHLQQVDEQESHRHHAEDDAEGADYAFLHALRPVHLGKEERKGHGRRQEREAHDDRVPQIVVEAREKDGCHKNGGQPVGDDEDSLLHSNTKVSILPGKQSIIDGPRVGQGDLTEG